MRFRKLDMNLLYALSVLVEERSVSRAAERLHVSQPTMSAVLARLREYFGDPLLVQQGRFMVPSSLALAFAPMLREVLTNINVMIAASSGFDPETSERTFCISTSDYFAGTLLPGLIKRVKRAAPGTSFEIVTSQGGFSRVGEKSEVDVVLLPAEFMIPGHPAKILYHESYVVLGCAQNPLFSSGISEEDFYASPHLTVAPSQGNRTHSISEAFLQSRGRPHHVEIVTSSFLYAPDLLVGSSRLLMLPRRLAERFAAIFPVSIAELPFEFKGFEAIVQHHTSRSADPGIGWLIGQIESELDIDKPDTAT